MSDLKTSLYCKKCSLKTFHDEQYDSMFCVICNTWNEDVCSDDHCCYCINRAETPLTDYIHSIYVEAYNELGFDAVWTLLDDVHNECEYREIGDV